MPSFFLNSYAPYRPLLDAGQFRHCIESAQKERCGLSSTRYQDRTRSQDDCPLQRMVNISTRSGTPSKSTIGSQERAS
jgi:hypothetical protein